MGELLQVRVSCYTFDEDAVKKKYPALTKCVWEQPYAPNKKYGIIELVKELKDKVQLGQLDKLANSPINDLINDAYNKLNQLEKALADWEPKKADNLSYDLEDLLSDIESKVKKI